MIRILLTAAIGIASASAAFAEIQPGEAKGRVVPAALSGEAKSSNCKTCSHEAPAPYAHLAPGYSGHKFPSSYTASGMRHQMVWDRHECAPDGCPKPVGCSNFWGELKFVFGSCRQFFGTGESTINHHRNTTYRP